MVDYDKARDCEHGRQIGKCGDCEYQDLLGELSDIRAERDALKAELKATESRLHEVAVGCANAEFELEAARKQEPAIYRLRYTEATSGWVDVTKEVYDRHKDSQNYDARVFYASPVPAQQLPNDARYAVDPIYYKGEYYITGADINAILKGGENER